MVKLRRWSWKKDDRNTVYKIELTENGVEKEYKIDSNSGKILKVEREDEDDEEDEDNVDLSKADIKIKLDDAKKIALDKFPGSMIKEYSIEKEHGKLIYKIETVTDNSKEELEIDANTGKILNMDSEKNHDVNLKDKAKISMEEAEKIALQEVPGGTIKGSELKDKHSKLVYEVEINNKTANKEFKIDANNGKIIDAEEDWN